MYIIIGLGNPTDKYQATRHNVGWDAITRISDDYNIALNMKRHKAICGSGYIEGEKVILAQPYTYMNLSGESVRALVDFYKVSTEEIIVIYDDISLDVGQLRIRKKGSAGGHNGIKSIISHLGTEEFPRIKVGIGNKPKEWDLADYVLSRFKGEEEVAIREALKDTSDACRMIITDGMDSAMNKYNKKKVTKEEAEGKKSKRRKAKARSKDNNESNDNSEPKENNITKVNDALKDNDELKAPEIDIETNQSEEMNEGIINDTKEKTSLLKKIFNKKDR